MSEWRGWWNEVQAEIDELSTCPDCSNTDIRQAEEFMRPCVIEHRCDKCGWIGRRFV